MRSLGVGTRNRHIRLRGIKGAVEGLIWENEAMLRAGRLASLEMVLDDSSVSRRHAEIRSTANGLAVRMAEEYEESLQTIR